jgi:hypothetical protein
MLAVVALTSLGLAQRLEGHGAEPPRVDERQGDLHAATQVACWVGPEGSFRSERFGTRDISVRHLSHAALKKQRSCWASNPDYRWPKPCLDSNLMRSVYLMSTFPKVLAPAILSVFLGCQSGGGMRTPGTGGDSAGGSGVGGGGSGGSATGGSGGSATGGSDGAASTCQLDSACPESGVQAVQPSCVPGSLDCQDANLRTCDPMGFWEVTRKCPDLCRAGACVGVCIPGTLGCRYDISVSERCSDDGTWVEIETCGGSTPTCFEGKCMAACLQTGGNCTDQPLACCRGPESCASTGYTRYCR